MEFAEMKESTLALRYETERLKNPYIKIASEKYPCAKQKCLGTKNPMTRKKLRVGRMIGQV